MTESPPDAPVFFIDRCLGRHTVPDTLKANGYRAECHDDHFDQSVPDDEWLPIVGKRGWVILTRDRNIARNQIELRALFNSGAPAFVLTGSNMTGAQSAAAFITAMQGMQRFLKKFSPPFVAHVTAAGNLRMHLTASGVIKKL